MELIFSGMGLLYIAYRVADKRSVDGTGVVITALLGLYWINAGAKVVWLAAQLWAHTVVTAAGLTLVASWFNLQARLATVFVDRQTTLVILFLLSVSFTIAASFRVWFLLRHPER
jgi:hypothetical protein